MLFKLMGGSFNGNDLKTLKKKEQTKKVVQSMVSNPISGKVVNTASLVSLLDRILILKIFIIFIFFSVLC